MERKYRVIVYKIGEDKSFPEKSQCYETKEVALAYAKADALCWGSGCYYVEVFESDGKGWINDVGGKPIWKSDEKQKYGVFVYKVNDDEDGPEESHFFDDKEIAIETGKTAFLSWGGYYVEVWERDEQGMFGNCGEALYKSDDSSYAEEEEKKEKQMWFWAILSSDNKIVDAKISDDPEKLLQYVREDYGECGEEIISKEPNNVDGIRVYRDGNLLGKIEKVDAIL